jgi:hypothetical protein
MNERGGLLPPNIKASPSTNPAKVPPIVQPTPHKILPPPPPRPER